MVTGKEGTAFFENVETSFFCYCCDNRLSNTKIRSIAVKNHFTLNFNPPLTVVRAFCSKGRVERILVWWIPRIV